MGVTAFENGKKKSHWGFTEKRAFKWVALILRAKFGGWTPLHSSILKRRKRIGFAVKLFEFDVKKSTLEL